MAEKEVKIKVSTETDTSQLEELDSLIEDIQEKADIQGEVDVDDTSVVEADEDTQTLSDDLDEVDGKVVTPDVDTSGFDELQAKLDETSSSMDSVATAAVGIGASAGLEQMISTADRINTSWNQLELTFGTVTEDMKSKISGLSTTTGRSGGEIRNYFNQMGIAGVTNTNLLSSSFEALAGKSYQTGNSIEMMESKMQTMVLTGNASGRMLKSLGLDAEDLAQVMGVSADQVSEAFKNMTPEERLQAITQAMGDGARANDMYKNSYEGLKAQADAAMAGLMGAVGQAILPIVVPALQAATNAIKFLTDGFKSLPGPVQAIIGGIGGFAAIALTVVGVLGTFGQIVSMVKGGLEALNLITKLSTLYTQAAAAAQWLWNIAMSANPIGILIIAIGALIAILAYLYLTNEDVRNAINGVAEAIMNFLGPAIDFATGLFENFTNALGLNTDNWTEAILGFILFLPMLPATIALSLAEALAQFLGFTGGLEEMITTTLENLWSYITTLGGLIPESVNITGNQVIDSIIRVMIFIQTLPLQLAIIFANAIAQVLGFGNNFVQRMYQSAVNSVSKFMGQIRQLPGKFQAELNNMLSAVGRWAATLPAKFWEAGVNAVKNFLAALGINSPGIMQRTMVWEVSEMARRVPIEGKQLVSNIGSLGEDVVESFDPKLNGVNFANTSVVDGVGGIIGGSGVAGGDTVINIYGDVDSEERVKFILETIRKELLWNNQTAGRTN